MEDPNLEDGYLNERLEAVLGAPFGMASEADLQLHLATHAARRLDAISTGFAWPLRSVRDECRVTSWKAARTGIRFGDWRGLCASEVRTCPWKVHDL